MTGGLQKQFIFLYFKGSYTHHGASREKENGGRSLQGFYEAKTDVVDLQLPGDAGIILHLETSMNAAAAKKRSTKQWI